MKISEIFQSIQGEGILVGTPSVFVRTSGCNLRCKWCDTPYTSWEAVGEELDVDQILARVRGFRSRHVVVTGGEPMIAPDVVELTQRLRSGGRHITIETAGTVFAPVACDLMSISPKISNSTPYERDGGRWAAQHERLRIQRPVLERMMSGYEYQLKFVVEKPDDLGEIVEFIGELNADRQRVVLMPEGTDATVLRERGVWIADACVKEGFRFSPRLHVELWGNRRGV